MIWDASDMPLVQSYTYDMTEMELEIYDEITKLRERQMYVMLNKNEYENWLLTWNRIDLTIDKLHKEQEMIRILAK